VAVGAAAVAVRVGVAVALGAVVGVRVGVAVAGGALVAVRVGVEVATGAVVGVRVGVGPLPLLTVKLAVMVVVPPAERLISAVIEWLPFDRLAVLYGFAAETVPPAKSQGGLLSVHRGVPVAEGLSSQKLTRRAPLSGLTKT
jgi:hypothetical protein